MSENEPGYTLNRTADVAVAVDYYYEPMSSCPKATKVILLNAGCVAVIGEWDGKDHWWRGWAPLPRERKE